MSALPRIRDLSELQLSQQLAELGEPAYRVRQILQWVWLKRASSFEAMSNISKPTRAMLAERFDIDAMREADRRVSAEGDAVKFGLNLHESDGITECVLLIDRQRRTACLSAQLGCALGCTFCATGAMGFVRNLTQAEVLGQLVAVNDYLHGKGDKPVTHVVFMGMGEALYNYDVFAGSCGILHAEWGFGLALRRITVSTAGVVPSIERLTTDGPFVNLAISLNAADDEYRSRIMPINRRYPIAEVVAAGKRYAEKSGMGLTFEYVVVAGETDTPEAIGGLIRLLHGVPCKVNCIPLNPTSVGSGSAPEYEGVLKCVRQLHEHGVTATARRSRGRDIDGACGQLTSRRQ